MPEPEEERPKRTRSIAIASTWGRPPEHTTHWSIGKKEGTGFPRKDWKEKGEQTATNIWPLAMLDARMVCHHWGPGEYRVTWIGTVQGTRRTTGVGRTVKVLPEDTEGEGASLSQQVATPAPAPVPAAAAPPPLPDALGQFQTLWGISQQQKDAELTRDRESFNQQLKSQAQTYDQLLLLQAKMMERPTSPADEERMARAERSIRRLRRALEEREQEMATEAALATREPTSPWAAILAQLAPHIPVLLQAVPALVHRFVAGATAVARPEVIRP